MSKILVSLLPIGLCLTASIAHASPIPTHKHEVIQFYNSSGHTAAVAKGATKVPSCTASDVCGTSLKFDTTIGGKLTVTAKSPGTTGYVIEDLSPKNGGLGVIGFAKNSFDNIGKGEALILKFDKVVELKEITFFDSQHLADFYHTKTANAQFRLDVFNNGAKTTGIYSLENHFRAETPFVGNEFIFTGLLNDVTLNNLTKHFSYYVGGLDISTHLPPVPPTPPTPPKPPTPPTPPSPPSPPNNQVPEPGTLYLLASALLALAVVRRRV